MTPVEGGTMTDTDTETAAIEYLDGKMRPGDLVEVLAHLRFRRSSSLQTIKNDRDVAKFLIDAVRARAGTALR
jgi:hypothetical protein